MTDIAPLSHDELLSLWEHGRHMALARCSSTLRALRRGRGGFYEADDLWQDLFLDFWDLVRRWHGGPPPRHAEDLWAAWQRHLRRGGWRVLRRRPQRLWHRHEQAVDPREMELDDESFEEHDAPPTLPFAARQALIEAADLEEAWEARAAAEVAERRLWGLSVINRQALYLTSVVGLSHTEVNRCLALEDKISVQNRIHRARRSLRRGTRATDST